MPRMPPSSWSIRSRRIRDLDYVIVEDGAFRQSDGVDGQIYGGNWRRASARAVREMPFVESGQTLAHNAWTICYRGDRGAARALDHMETPAPNAVRRQGIGAGGRHPHAGGDSPMQSTCVAVVGAIDAVTDHALPVLSKANPRPRDPQKARGMKPAAFRLRTTADLPARACRDGRGPRARRRSSPRWSIASDELNLRVGRDGWDRRHLGHAN